MKQFITRNFWLKLTALFLAVIIWAYVVGELKKGTPDEKALLERFIPYKLYAKEVPIKITIIGTPRPGYRLQDDQISVQPDKCVLMAPKNVLKRISYAATEEINVNEYTKPVMKKFKLKPINGITMENDISVLVTLPIQKIEEPLEVKK